MHSSRMRTARLLPVAPSLHCAEGGCTLSPGVPDQGVGGTWSGECAWFRGDVPGPRGYTWFQGGVPGPRGVTWSGG